MKILKNILEDNQSALVSRFYELCSPVIQEVGLELYDLEYFTQNSLLRLYIIDSKTGTAQIEDCAKIDRALSEPFDQADWIPENIVLEVSSPGLFRKLRLEKHFEQAKGSPIEVNLNGAVEKLVEKGLINGDWDNLEDYPRSFRTARKFRGVLKSVNETTIQLINEDNQIHIDLESVKKAQLSPEF